MATCFATSVAGTHSSVVQMDVERNWTVRNSWNPMKLTVDSTNWSVEIAKNDFKCLVGTSKILYGVSGRGTGLSITYHRWYSDHTLHEMTLALGQAIWEGKIAASLNSIQRYGHG